MAAQGAASVDISWHGRSGVLQQGGVSRLREMLAHPVL
jgi:hypothetical protein